MATTLNYGVTTQNKQVSLSVPSSQCNTAGELTPGCKIGMSFAQGILKHEKFGTVNCSGVIPLVLPYGTYVAPSLTKDKARLESMIQKLIVEYRNLWEEDLDETLALKIRDYLMFAVHLNPLDDPDTPGMEAFISLVILIFAIDDLLDSLTEGSEDSLKYDDMRNIIKFLNELFRGVYKSLDEIANPMAAIQCTNAYCLKFMKLSQAAIPGFLEKNEFLRQDWIDSVCCFVLLMEKDSSGREFSYTSKNVFGSHISGLCPGLEMVTLVRGLSVPREVRDGVLFQRMKIAFGSVSHLMNDVFGIGRDMELNQIRDSSILTQVVSKGTAVQEAFDIAFGQLCADINDAHCAAEKLRACYRDNQDVLEYIDCLERAIDGQFYWYQQTTRYGHLNLKVVRI